jgi:flagellar FliL protein
MAEENENEIVDEKSGVGTPMMILGAAVLLVLGAVGGILGADMVNGEAGETPSEATEEGEELADGTRVVAETTTYDLGEFSLNLKDPSTMRILQMNIVVECEADAVQKIEEQRAQLRDAVIMFTSEYTVSSLAGLEGKMNLRDEILMRVNAILKPQRVERVYFTKFIIGK